ncbi:MAG: hypothetical protein ABI679_02510 [Gemmatimonadota bacterium]
MKGLTSRRPAGAAGVAGGGGGRNPAGGTAAWGRPRSVLLVRLLGATTGGIATDGRAGIWVTPRGAVVRGGSAGLGAAAGGAGDGGGAGAGGGLLQLGAGGDGGATIAGTRGSATGGANVGTAVSPLGRPTGTETRASPGEDTWKTAAQTRQRARTPRSGTLAGSTRYTVLQLGQVTFMRLPLTLGPGLTSGPGFLGIARGPSIDDEH